jgi:hypothetical protein
VARIDEAIALERVDVALIGSLGLDERATVHALQVQVLVSAMERA